MDNNLDNDDLNKNFKGLNDKLGTDYVDKDYALKVIKDIKNEVKEMNVVKSELTSMISKPLILQDQEFLREQSKSLLLNARTVLQRLEKDLKIGSDSRMFEAWAKSVDSVVKLLAELRTLNVDIAKLDKEVDTKKDNILNKKMNLSMGALFDMISNAEKNNQTNKIDADFKIVDEKDDIK